MIEQQLVVVRTRNNPQVFTKCFFLFFIYIYAALLYLVYAAVNIYIRSTTVPGILLIVVVEDRVKRVGS